MKITKEENQLVIRIPLEQNSYDCTGELIGKVPNIIGYSDGKEFSINYLISLGYKDDIQLGIDFIKIESEEELEKICKELNIDIWRYDRCIKCDRVLYGSFTLDKNLKPICIYECK